MAARIARELGKFLWEVEETMPLEEFDTWCRIFELEDEERKTEEARARRKQQHNQRGIV